MGLTQIPVMVDGSQLARCVRITASKVFTDRDLLEAPVSKIMDKGFPTVDVDADVNVVSRKLRTNPAVLIEEYGRITGIITRHDVFGDGRKRGIEFSVERLCRLPQEVGEADE